jgi:flagellar basal body-associated protein FliL
MNDLSIFLLLFGIVFISGLMYFVFWQRQNKMNEWLKKDPTNIDAVYEEIERIKRNRRQTGIPELDARTNESSYLFF